MGATPPCAGLLRAPPPHQRAQIHSGLFTKAVLAASGAEVVIGKVEHVVALDGQVAGVMVKVKRQGHSCWFHRSAGEGECRR